MEYIRLTIEYGGALYRVYCHNSISIEAVNLQDFLTENEAYYNVNFVRVELSDHLDIDDMLKIIMVDETGIYFW